MQGLDVAVFVIGGYILTETVSVRIDAGCFAVSGVHQTAKSVVSELIATDSALISSFPRHAADAAVVFGGAVAVVVVQILCKLASTDSRQPATDIIGIRQLVGGTSVQRLGLQSAQVVIRIVGKGYLGAA